MEAFWKEQFWPLWTELQLKRSVWSIPLVASMGPFVSHAKHCFEQHDLADETLATLDTAFARLKLICQYVRVCESATPEKEKRFDEVAQVDEELAVDVPPTQRERFFEALSGVGMRTLEEARLLLREAEQGIFVRQLP